jgi:hypothetical protein
MSAAKRIGSAGNLVSAFSESRGLLFAFAAPALLRGFSIHRLNGTPYEISFGAIVGLIASWIYLAGIPGGAVSSLISEYPLLSLLAFCRRGSKRRCRSVGRDLDALIRLDAGARLRRNQSLCGTIGWLVVPVRLW